MAYLPSLKGRSTIEMTLPPYIVGNIGPNITEIFFSGTYNAGLSCKFSIYDTDIERWEAFMRNVWFPKKLKEDLKVNFRFYFTGGEYPETSTRSIELSISRCSVRSRGDFSGMIIDFMAISTADYELSYAASSGKAYKGRISDVIKQVIGENTSIQADITKTLDNKENYWYMMRQRPPRFIRQLMETGTMFTKSKTQMVYGVKQYAPIEKIKPLISVVPQGEVKPKNLGTYRNPAFTQIISVGNEDYFALMNKISTGGISTLSGDYIDIKTDTKEIYCIAKDANTNEKILAGYPLEHGLKKQNDVVGFLKGTSYVDSPPELYSDGSTGFLFKDYIRNQITNTYLNHVHNLTHVRFEFNGIGIMDNTIGLGTDTIYIEFRRPAEGSGTKPQDAALDGKPAPFHYWTGNWTILGFEHVWNIDAKLWTTLIDCARFTTDTNAVRFNSKD